MDDGSGAWLTFSHVRLRLGKMVLIGNEGLEEVPTPTATPTSTPPPSVEAESFGSKLLEDVSTPQVSHCMHV